MSLRRLFASLLFWIGLALAATGAASTVTGQALLPMPLWAGGSLMAFGLNTLIGGELIAGPQPRPFNVRGQVVRGEVVVRAGMNDLLLNATTGDRVALVHHGPLGKPKLSVEDGVAKLRLAGGLLPNIAKWDAGLAKNVLWDIDARSGLGNLTLDLSGLRVERVVARTGLGRMEITCPSRGFTQLFLRTGGGEIIIHLPEHVGARLLIEKNGLATLRVENRRVQALDERRYITPDFEAAAAQVEIKIQGGAGDVVIA